MSQLCGKITDREGGANVGRRSKLNCDDDPARVSRRRFDHASTLEIDSKPPKSACSELKWVQGNTCIAKPIISLRSD